MSESLDMAALEKLRNLGVKKATLYPNGSSIIEVEFFPAEHKREGGPILPKEMSQNAPHMEDKCACGHLIDAHDGEGLCLIGGAQCPIERCAGSMSK